MHSLAALLEEFGTLGFSVLLLVAVWRMAIYITNQHKEHVEYLQSEALETNKLLLGVQNSVEGLAKTIDLISSKILKKD